jgi:hypothetical protein
LRVYFVAITHFGVVAWPQVLSCHATHESAHAAACRDNYIPNHPTQGTVFYGPYDHHPTRVVIAMDVQP